jgi:hypothetical protein
MEAPGYFEFLSFEFRSFAIDVLGLITQRKEGGRNAPERRSASFF